MFEDIPQNLNDLPPEERDRIINEIIEQVIKPQLEGMEGMFPDHEGEAFVFGSNDKEQAEETIERIQSLLQDGLSMDYIIQEMTDLHLSANVAKQVGDMTINFISLESEKDSDVENLSADELRDMFENS